MILQALFLEFLRRATIVLKRLKRRAVPEVAEGSSFEFDRHEASISKTYDKQSWGTSAQLR